VIQNDDFKTDQDKVNYVIRLIKTPDPSDDFSTFREGMSEYFCSKTVRPVLQKIKETPEAWNALTPEEQHRVLVWLDSVFLGDRVTTGFGLEPKFTNTNTGYFLAQQIDGSYYQLGISGYSRFWTGETSSYLDLEKTFGQWMTRLTASAVYDPAWNNKNTHTLETFDGEMLTDEDTPDDGVTQNLPVTLSLSVNRRSKFKLSGDVKPTFYFTPKADTPESALTATGELEWREINLWGHPFSVTGTGSYSNEQYTPPSPDVVPNAEVQSFRSANATVSPTFSISDSNEIGLEGKYTQSTEQEYYSMTDSVEWTGNGIYQYTGPQKRTLRVAAGAQRTDSTEDRTDIDVEYATQESTANLSAELRTPLVRNVTGTFLWSRAHNWSQGNLKGDYPAEKKSVKLEWTPGKFVNSLSYSISDYAWDQWYTPEEGTSYPEGDYTLLSRSQSLSSSIAWSPDSWSISATLAWSLQHQEGTFFPSDSNCPEAQLIIKKKVGDKPRTVLYGYGYGYNYQSKDQFTPGATQSEMGYGAGFGLSMSSIKLWAE
jgi:hypothetical protein